jgi:membrane associated rhomboid family serine protease
MDEFSSYKDYGPITWFKRKPIYLSTILAALAVLGMFITAFLMAARADVNLFAFDPLYFWKGNYLWQIITYPLLNVPSFFFIFGIFMFFWFGVDVERYLGRTRYSILLTFLILTPVVVNSLLWVSGHVWGQSAGMNDLAIGFFIAFATLYPNVEYWDWITMKWLAFACIVLSLMLNLVGHDIPGFITTLALCAVAFGYVRFLQKGAEFPKISTLLRSLFHRKPKFKVVRAEPSEQEALHESIDPLLDKISRTGLSSLTAREKAQLQRARESLLKKPE